MLKRRVLAALLALVLAAVGGLLLLNYVNQADQRAMAGLQTVQVLVVKAAVPQGAGAGVIGQQVALKTLPRTAVAPGALSSLSQVAGRVTTTELQPGEQLLARRFVDPASLRRPGEVQLPRDSHQISVSIGGPQAVGGYLKAGDYVSLFANDPKSKQMTRVMEHLFIAKVVGGVAPPPPDAGGSAPPPSAPAGSLLITFAVTTAEGERLLSQLPNNPWLSLEPINTKSSTSKSATTKPAAAQAGSTSR